MTLLSVAEVLVKVIGYTMILYGIWLLVGQYVIKKAFQYIYQDVKRRRYIKRLNRINTLNFEAREKPSSLFHEHIEKLILSVQRKSGNSKQQNPTLNFYIISLFLFSVSFMILLLLIKDFVLSLILGTLFMSLPYVFLRMRLIHKRFRTSMAFMNNFHIIQQAYNTNSQNAYYMVRNITEELDDKELKNTFIKLLAAMQREKHEEDFRKAIVIFAYSINSSFAIRFGNLLSKAYLASTNISSSLEDLSKDVMARRNDLDNERSLNVETKILGYLPIITLPIFVFAAKRLSTMYDFWSLFNHKVTLIAFIAAVIFTGVSLFSVIVLTKPRSDI